MGRVRMLKGTSFPVDFDFPKEMWPFCKELRNTERGSKIQMAYPAKVIKNERVVKDAMPDWTKYVSANRLQHLDTIVRDTPVHTRTPHTYTSLQATRPPKGEAMDVQMPINNLHKGRAMQRQHQYRGTYLHPRRWRRRPVRPS